MRRRLQNPVRAARVAGRQLETTCCRSTFAGFVQASARGLAAAWGSYGTDTASAVSASGSENCSILRWAIADLGVVLMEVGRRSALLSAETPMAGVSRGRLVARN